LTTHHPEFSRENVFVCQRHFPLRLVEGQHQEVWRTDLTKEKKEEGRKEL
jgi:tRNA G37 N-methylase TrmD